MIDSETAENCVGDQFGWVGVIAAASSSSGKKCYKQRFEGREVDDGGEGR